MIEQLIKEWAQKFPCTFPDSLDPEAILWAVWHCEKYDQYDKEPRFEASYAPGGYFYDTSEEVRMNWAVYGRSAACSYSNFQIMYPTARELGYVGPPVALDKDEIALPYVVALICKRIIDAGATTPEQVADAYNSGSFKDNYKPEAYMKKFRCYYDKAIARKEPTPLEETDLSKILDEKGNLCQPDSTNEQGDSTTDPKTSPEG